ncbi:MAG: MBL fold metallo-hydrolase [Candidatus Micrarchaeota archaeon]|nr:MBL fold metallo-hydrolase [Candidatus Micrarchaeota archaeon]
MEITFLGASQEVGRSSFLLSDQENILLDCGLKIHADQTFPIEPPHKVDYAVMSHAHLDHSGNFPSLFKNSSPEVICTPPTAAMAQIIIEDSMRIMAKRGEFPFRAAHVKRMQQHNTLLSFNKKHQIGETELKLYSAGHIPGAAICDLDNGDKRVVYSGDFKLEETKTTFASEIPPVGPDALIMESTYFDRDHPTRKDLEMQLGEQMSETLENGGTVLFPAFAIGRTQELIRIIRTQNRDVDIWVDGMGSKVNEILSHYPSYMKDFKQYRRDLDSCKIIFHKSDRGKVLHKPGVIIATAGMLQGGPALGYLLKLGPESKAIFTGYSVPDTNGHNLLNKGYVEYDGVHIKPKASYSYLDFSAHAGRSELFKLAETLKPDRVFVVHGDHCAEFAEELKLEGFEAMAPALGETIEI